MAYSGSSSAASPTTERLQYRLSREEPVQASRGARRLKKKGKDPSNPKKHQKSSKHTEKVQVMKFLKILSYLVAKLFLNFN